MQKQLRNGFNAGLTFGVVLIFLILIGFPATWVEIISGIFGRGIRLRAGSEVNAGAIIFNATLFILMSLWAGARASQPSEQNNDQSTSPLAQGAAAGAAAGLLIAVFTLIIGLVQQAGVDMREEFAALSKEVVKLVLFSAPPILGALINLVLMTGSGLLGALLGNAIRGGNWRDYLNNQWASTKDRVGNISIIRRIDDSQHTDLIMYGIVLFLLLLMPLALDQFWNYNMGTVGIYVLLGLGLNVVVGLAGLLDLGYVAFFAIGAYTVSLLTAPEPHALGWSFWAALPLGIALAAAAGILLGIPVLRMRGDYLAIVTLGFGEIIRILSKSDVLSGFTGGPRGVRGVAGPVLFGRPFSGEREFLYLIILGCLVLIFVTSRLQNSRVGRAWIAMREDETVAQAMGINTWQYKLMAFAIGAAFAGLGGVLFASRNQFTGPEDHNLLVSINVLCLVIVGGMGSIPGVVVGSLALKGLPEMLRQLETFRMLAFGGLLVAMMVLRPEGLWPSRRRRLELEQDDMDLEETVPPPEEFTPSVGGDRL